MSTFAAVSELANDIASRAEKLGGGAESGEMSKSEMEREVRDLASALEELDSAVRSL